ncbi:MAG TPA: type II CAAX endopeptidase family protein [Actinomycetota bacterium]|nr:type II CAAX endopeptidase family protein [Actinomycetota bacterium]
MEERLRAPWSPWEAVPLALAAFTTAFVVAILLTAVLGGPGGPTAVLAEIAFEGAMFAFTLAWVRIRYPDDAPALGLGSRRPGRDAFVGAVVGLALFFAAAIVLLRGILFVFEALGIQPPTIQQIRFPLSPLNLALGLFLVVVAAPFAEEVFFRGFLYTSLRGRLGVWPAALVSSAIFGVFHVSGGPILVPLLFLVGLAFAFLYEWRRSLVASIAAHATFNAIGYTLIIYERLFST